MKKYGIMVAIGFIMASCSQTETKTETIENPDGTTSVKTIETEKTSALDSATIQNTVNTAKEKLNVAGEKLDEAADNVREDLRTKKRDTVR